MFSFILPKERSDKLSFRNCSNQMSHVISVRQNESLETRAKSYKMKLLIYILIGNSSPSIFLGIEQMTVGRKDDQIKLGKSWVGKTGEGRRC